MVLDSVDAFFPLTLFDFYKNKIGSMIIIILIF